MGEINYTLGQVFERFINDYKQQYPLTSYPQKVVNDIQHCRTEAMGGHWSLCDNCGEIKKHYNSCGNRHCPTCQGINKERWILERTYDLLPVKYFHVIFTVPSELRMLFMQNQQLLYNLLFKCAWKTIDEFAQDPRQQMMAKTGMTAILHTWTQKLLYHPHLHCIVPAGGIDKSNQWKTSKGKGDFLFYVSAVANKFRGKFMYHLHRYYQSGKLKAAGKTAVLLNPKVWQQLKDKLYKTNWVVNCKEPFKGPETVIEYLGRYTHKIAISNYRIKKITETTIGFTYLDRNDGNKQKYLELPGVKFIQRFLCHIVPHRFTRIRHYGFLSTRVKTAMLKEMRKILKHPDPGTKPKFTVRQVIKIVYGHDINLCQSCMKGALLVFEKWTKDRASPMDIEKGLKLAV
ncbi:MAG: IS91 family transposase [Bacteroidales bacterium]|jgi:hypothetical protein|nr:IS91 family transposase [Bacteroidales bacterium]